MSIHVFVCSEAHTSEQTFPLGKKKDAIRCHCGKKAKRQISFPNIHFKGEGFSRSLIIPSLKDQKPKTPGEVTKLSVSTTPPPPQEVVKGKPRYFANS